MLVVIVDGGIAYAIYMYFKEKKDAMFFVLVFSLVSIYMSFEAARFNITAAPAYAILGAGLLMAMNTNPISMTSMLSRRTGVNQVE